jgi:cell division protein FtsI/penicillin-binding protein 2
MKILFIITTLLFAATLLSCSNPKTEQAQTSIAENYVYAKEPNDSSDYKHIKYDFYLSKTGQLCERKLAGAKGTNCNCLFQVYYDSTFKIYTGYTIIEHPLNTIVDINSFVWVDSTQFSKDKDKVFYFNENSDGGIREVIVKADPTTFKRLCEYRWGIDRNHVFYMTYILQGINLKTIQVLFPPDTADHFIQYVKDDRKVFHENEIVKGADATTFKVVSGQKWDAEDKNYKYENGRRQE